MIKKVRPLCIMLPKMSSYRRDSDETKCMSFVIKNIKLPKKYNEIWVRVSKVIIRDLILSPHIMIDF